MPTKQKTRLLAVLALLFTATLWGIIWYPLRLLDNAGLGGLWSSLVVYAAALSTGLFALWRNWHSIVQHPRLSIAMLLFGGWTNVAFILAVLDGNVVRVLLLFYLSPIWAMILGWLFLHERPTPVMILAFVIAMAGAFTMLWLPDANMTSAWQTSDWLAISSGLAFALTNTTVRKAQYMAIWPKAVLTWLGVVSVAIVIILVQGQPVPHVSMMTILFAILLGLIGMVSMTLAVQYGVTHMRVQQSSVILLFELVAGAVSAQLLTNEQILLREWLGGSLIILAALLVARQVTKE